MDLKWFIGSQQLHQTSPISNPHHHLNCCENLGIINFLRNISVFCCNNFSLRFLNQLLHQIKSSPMCNPCFEASFSSNFRLVYTCSNVHLLPCSRFTPNQRVKFRNTRSSNNCWKSDLHSISVVPNEDWLGIWKENFWDLVLFGYFFPFSLELKNIQTIGKTTQEILRDFQQKSKDANAFL